MEFPFNINNILKHKITKVKQNLLPEGFSGDRRSAWDHASKISDILDEMGRASAVAQGLQKAITSGERLRNSEHTVYLLIDPEGKSGEGSVVGLLKMGRKKLFVFDAAGAHHEMQPLCVLDFYVHESKQRMGCGKTLYEYMLREENTSPQYLAIDRPSEKFLGFLYKHYGLQKILPQTNNFVVFEGFFTDNPDQKNSGSASLLQSRSTNHLTPESQSRSSPIRLSSETQERYNGLQQTLYGRYAAHRPPSTIGKILQNSGSQQHQHNGMGIRHKFHILENSFM
ncbi:alpha-tubulin N-acetyltransferase 1-like isoform X2 [Periplaneta americana]|uniref:alpha-tubulin N-acetyltransferase 1-like isoform X2 n=1 Tax=Periplaneta americana TaxID=6978 RepID=UPI0037E91AEB